MRAFLKLKTAHPLFSAELAIGKLCHDAANAIATLEALVANEQALRRTTERESSERTEKDWLIDNMAMLIRTLAYSLSKVEKYRKKAEDANDFLIRHNLQGSPLRNEIKGGQS